MKGIQGILIRDTEAFGDWGVDSWEFVLKGRGAVASPSHDKQSKRRGTRGFSDLWENEKKESSLPKGGLICPCRGTQRTSGGDHLQSSKVISI